MLTRNQAATGKTVYGGGSFAPNQGQVSAKGAQGYVKREMSNQAKSGNRVFSAVSNTGRDGKSDTRSGIAQTIIHKNKPKTVESKPNKPKKKPVGTKPAAAVVKPAVPTVTINSAGQIQLPYSQAWTDATYDATAQANSDLLSLQQEQQQNALAYAQSKRQAGLDFDTLRRDTLNSASGMGTAFSSGYGNKVQNNATAFNNAMNDLDSQNALNNQNADAERTAITAGIQEQLRRAALTYANEQSAKAGSLGYGTTKSNKPKPKAKPKTKPKTVEEKPNKGKKKSIFELAANNHKNGKK